jgi:hypothetical protein
MPAPVIWIILPETTATDGFDDVYVTSREELEVAPGLRSGSPYVTSGNALNVIVWLPLLTVRS